MKTALAATLLLALPSSLPAAPRDRLADRVERVMSRPAFRCSFLGVEFLDLATGQSLYAWNANKLFVPNSTTKLTTADTALALLGPDHRFRTQVYRTGPLDAEGILDGD